MADGTTSTIASASTAPRIRVRCSDPEISPEQFAWTLDGHDVSPLLQTAGLSFVRELRLQPGDRRGLSIRLNPSLPLTHPVTLQIDLYAYPSADHPNQTLEVTISPPATQAPTTANGAATPCPRNHHRP